MYWVRGTTIQRYSGTLKEMPYSDIDGNELDGYKMIFSTTKEKFLNIFH